jgi:ribosomal protein S18 acetylase RimI-like enzyme
MTEPIIRPARADEYDEMAHIWMGSWLSTGLQQPSAVMLANMRARISEAAKNGSNLFVADGNGTVGAILVLDIPDNYLDLLFIAPQYQGQGLGRRLLTYSRELMPNEIWLRCIRENDKAWRWYEREGFVFEKQQFEPAIGFWMKHYRWKREGSPP